MYLLASTLDSIASSLFFSPNLLFSIQSLPHTDSSIFLLSSSLEFSTSTHKLFCSSKSFGISFSIFISSTSLFVHETKNTDTNNA